MPDLRLGRYTDAETGHAPICTRELDGPLCAAPAAWHIIWPGGDGGMACDEHAAEARSLDHRQIHRLARGACGLPGSLWVEPERRCVLDVGASTVPIALPDEADHRERA
jgi:hypothetical protein